MGLNKQIFTEDFKDRPYWWDRTPRPETGDTELPAQADVVIVGSGYTGLCAAIQTVRGGRHTVVVDAEAAGWGCSSRNGGQVSTSIKPGYHQLRNKYGHELAFGILQEGHNALRWIGEFIREEEFNCDFEVCGRFYAAHSLKHFSDLARKFEKPIKGLETDSYVVPRSEQYIEIGSDLYHGGVVHPRHASLDPGRYHQCLLEKARHAGVNVVPNCKAESISRVRDGFELKTQKGKIKARDLIIATSGYSGKLSSWHRRRIIPIGSYVIATEPLPDDLIRKLIPNDRMIIDTQKLVVYYRTCPERRRIIFGARVSIKETDACSSAPAVYQELLKRFPELKDYRISHSWMGFVGYTFDEMPHLGKHDGIYYSMGYCGSGVSLASYFGTRIGQQVLGLEEGRSPLEHATFETRPYYRGNPWFLSPTIRYYKWLDNQQ